MRQALLASIALTVGMTAWTQPAMAQKSDARVKVAATADKLDGQGKQVVTVTLTIDKGWHAYANPVGNELLAESQTTISFAVNGKALEARVEYPQGKIIVEKVTGDYRVYEDKVSIKATVQRAGGDVGPLEVSAKYQACNDKACLLPATTKITLP